MGFLSVWNLETLTLTLLDIIATVISLNISIISLTSLVIFPAESFEKMINMVLLLNLLGDFYENLCSSYGNDL